VQRLNQGHFGGTVGRAEGRPVPSLKIRGIRAKARRQRLLENATGSLVVDLWGFPAGVGVWLFYRLVRFAVKG
jgi:hypothetical protein